MARKKKEIVVPVNDGIMRINWEEEHQTYPLADGTKAPGASTCAKYAGAVASQGALMGWSWNNGKAGLKNAEVSKKAMRIGTIAHFLTDRYIDKLPYDLASNCTPEEISAAETACLKFGMWWDDGKWTSVSNEEQMVSETMRCGGTLDNVIQSPAGKRFLIDKKTSSGIYPDAWYQVAGLRAIWEEKHGEKLDGVGIIRIGKQDQLDDFEAQFLEHTEKYLRCFVAGKDLWWAIQGLK